MNPRILVLAGLLTLLNAIKPVTIDDPTYLAFARQIASDPTDPYGRDWFWYEEPESANRILAPAVFLYYLAAMMRLVGENIFVLKLLLFPWAWLLVGSLDTLLRRFAPGRELPFLVAAILSPALLPGFNLMLDLPALALGLAAIVRFLWAGDRESMGEAIISGLLLGLAMQTKYTTFVVPGVLLWATMLRGGWRRWLVTVGIALTLFVGWEAYLVSRYGESHFLISASGQGAGLFQRAITLLPFFLTYTGGLGCVWLLIGLRLIAVPRGWFWLAVVAVVVVHLLILLMDVRFVNDSRPSPMLFGPAEGLRETIQLAEPLFTALGVALVVVLGRLGWNAGREEREGPFLVGWLVLEAMGFFVLSPFAAARRLYGFFAVLPLLLAQRAEGVRVWGLVVLQVALALGYTGLDWFASRAQQLAAERAKTWIAEQGEPGTIHSLGHWGWQYYMNPDGVGMLTSDRTARPTIIRAGDWIVQPDSRIEQQHIVFGDDEVTWLHAIRIDGLLPLRTMSCYHGGRVPLEHFEGSVLEVRVGRAMREFVPRKGDPQRFHAGY